MVKQTAYYHAYVPGAMDQGGTYYGNCTQHQGDRGNGVRAIQRALNFCYQQGLAVDGSFGPKTYQALRTVQRQVGVTVDGKFGPQTMNAMKWPYFNNGSNVFSHCGSRW
jgi:peptidoglycan hydrolase-like protein with peptidoglycan-binding domain